MRAGFTFSQLAIIILVIIGLITTIMIALTTLDNMNIESAGNSLGEQGENIGDALGNCAVYGGTCKSTCIDGTSFGEELCSLGEVCCI